MVRGRTRQEEKGKTNILGKIHRRHRNHELRYSGSKWRRTEDDRGDFTKTLTSGVLD
jgi:hypothetical protein